MKMTKKKTMFARFITSMITAVMLAVVFSFSAVSVMAMAADETTETVTVEELSIEETEETEFSAVQLGSLENMTFEMNMLNDSGDFDFVLLAAGDGGEAASGSTTADTSYNKVINFFITWIRRIGAMVALVGAVMFGLAIKNNDAEQKQNGLLTMVAGFVVVAITAAVDMFDLFS